ncbi:MAG: hypothetical protein FE78DRAFT_87378 [Acidomyces sp. 'richmondensis']|nr:MAG: hypothetical protein FE78DRAFT_87378 [Acidomyces sp. 'richmondensis']
MQQPLVWGNARTYEQELDAFLTTSSISSNNTGICFKNAWDLRNARFQPCFMPFVLGLPAAVAVVVLTFQILGLVVQWRPRWTRPFVEEIPQCQLDEGLAPKRRWTFYGLSLASLAVVGFLLHLSLALRAWPSKIAQLHGLDLQITLRLLMPTATWFVVLVMVFTLRPKTAPFGILVILIIQTISESITLSSRPVYADKPTMGVLGTSLSLSILAVLAILAMPLRDPNLSIKEISQPFTEPTASLRSPEDNLTLWQFMTVSWMSSLIGIGYKRQVQDEDVWQLGYEFQHRRLHDNFRQVKGTVIQRLVKANIIDLLILAVLSVLETVAQYSVPLLLQRILSAMEDPLAPKSAAITYASLSLLVSLFKCQSGVFSLWFGRRCYERSRGEMITMLYEKTLGRKVSFQQPGKVNSNISDTAEESGTVIGQKQPFWSRFAARMNSLFWHPKPSTSPKEPASMGKILNLMRNDVYEVAQRFWEFQKLIEKPLSCIFSIVLVVQFLGSSSLLAVFLLILVQCLNTGLARAMVYFEKKRRKATDAKLQIISQFVEAIRHLRWYGWQNAWLVQIMSARQKELNLRVITNIWRVSIDFCNAIALNLTPVMAFFAYTVIAKQPLRVDIVFPAMQLFLMMTNALRDLPSLIIVLVNARVAVDRIEDFMAEPDKQEMSTEVLIGDRMAIEDGTFGWPGAEKPVLTDIRLSFPEGLTVICGEVASGKTAVLQALLGELDMFKGQLIRPPEPVGYCAQTPWLQNMSIRENILFSAPYDDRRYKDVLDACALTPDLIEFKAGDLSYIGENGIGLSGGQKARVALARAVYSRTKILLLDDPLSALDQQTAESIVHKCFAGPLMESRTVVLVTHRTDLVLGLAAKVVKMEGGKATVLDYDTATSESLTRTFSGHSKDIQHHETTEEQAAAAVPDKFIEDEHMAHGGVQAQVYWEYIKAGRLRWWILLVVTLIAFRTSSIAETWFLKAWAEAYNERLSIELLAQKEIVTTNSFDLFKEFPSPNVNTRPWLWAFFFLALFQSLTFAISQSVMIVIVYVAAKRMFRNIMGKVTNATFRFYDVTPIGRLMNRMTSDIGVIDGNISQQFQSVAWLGIGWLSSVIVIASVTPLFLAFSVVLTISFVVIFLRFLPTSQSLRRLEMVSLTPLMSNFGALLNGLTTVRAFCAQSRFQDRVIEVVDTFQKMDHFYWSLQAWLMYRFDALSAISTFLLTVLALVTNVSAGLTAFVLVSANRFVLCTHLMCRQYGELQMEFVSVERVVELLHLDQEPEGTIIPPAWWPASSGDIVFDKVTIKYAPHLEPALAGVSFTVRGGSKTAVIGRTGSGKSTLALAMLATVVPSNGHIYIDNIDLAEVDKQLLRTRITFLAQDPVLFPGTMRDNLDPVGEHSDQDCELVLHRVCERQGWDLDSKVEGGGRNLSQGQRQLVGLARAVLRRSSIIILDEATASIDRETAMQIQQVMHEEMKGSTVITIAHRLEAVRNADYCIVLGKGKILQQGPAVEMLRNHKEDMIENADEEGA